MSITASLTLSDLPLDEGRAYAIVIISSSTGRVEPVIFGDGADAASRRIAARSPTG